MMFMTWRLLTDTYLQSLRLRCEGRVVLQDLLQDNSSILLAQSFFKGRLEINILAVVVVDLVNQFRGKSQPNGIHTDRLEISNDFLDRLILKAFGDHHFTVTGPVGTGKSDGVASSVLDPSARRSEWSVWPGSQHRGRAEAKEGQRP